MAHRIGPHDALILRVDYFGDISYRERCAALADAAGVMVRDGYTRLLVDFTHANVHEEHDGSRADYIASVITAPWPDRTRIAPVNAPAFAVQGGRIAGTSRGLLVEGFDSEERAIEWLVSTA
jgi:hypothetical protein